MDMELIIKSILGLVVILAILIFIMFYMFPKENKQKSKQTKKKTTSTQHKDTSLEALRKIIKNKASSSKELSEALDLIIKHHGHIPKKTAARSHKDFDIYMDILFTICRHPNTNKDIIIKFDRELSKKNPEYKADINDAITKGLESRRIA